MSPADVREVLAAASAAVERADKPLGAPEVSPAVEAAFAAGRQAGLLEAAAMMRDSAKRLDDDDPDAIDRLMATTFRSCAESLEFDAGGAPWPSAPEPCQRPRSTTREDAALALLERGPATLDALAALLPASVGAGSTDPRHRRREVARVVVRGLCDEGRAVSGADGMFRRAP